MDAAKQFRHMQPWLITALVAAGVASFSVPSVAATTVISLQVTAVVQNTCSSSVMLPASAPSAAPTNFVNVSCQYGQAYTVNVQPAAVTVGTGTDKSAGSLSGNNMIVTVTY